MTIAEKAAAIAADIAKDHPQLAETVGAGPFGPILQQIIAAIMQALAGCGVAPPAAATMFGQQTGILGRLHKGIVRRHVNEGLRKGFKDSTLRAQLLEPVTTSIMKQGQTTTAEEIVAMTAEAGN